MSVNANTNAEREDVGVGSVGGRSGSFEMHRRGSRTSEDVGEGLGDARRGHAHARTTSGGSDSVKGGGEGRGMRGNGVPVVGAVAPPPKERLLPSPPLTPVASIESLRKKNATARDGRGELGVTPKSAKSNGRVTGDRRTSVGVGGTAADRNAGGADAGGDGEVTVDTEGDGAVSTWSFRPDGERETSGQDERANAFGGDYTGDGVGQALAQPSGVTAIPQSSTLLTGDKRDDAIPQEPTPPEEEGDPLRGSDVNAPAPQSFLNIFPFAGDSSSSAMPPAHEALANSKFPSDSRHPHPLQSYSPPSPQPWDLVSPPPGNNDPLEERMRRSRKESNRTVLGSSANIVVKDGKKYRIPHSSYYFGPPPDTSAFGTDPIGHIGVHHPREIIRIERDYSGGELCQFSPAYPLELEGRITPTKFLETVNAINETLIDAHSLRWSFLDNALAVFTLYISRLFVRSHYDRTMTRLKSLIEGLNRQLYNPAGLNILWPKDVAFIFLEIEYY